MVYDDSSLEGPKSSDGPGETADESRELVRRAQRGDLEAVAALYDRYAERVFRYCYTGLGDPQAAEDATSEVFLGVLKNLRTFQWRGEQSFEAWLFRIAHNVVISERRRRFRKPVDLYPRAEEIPSVTPGPSAEREAVEADGLGELWGAVLRLPETYRQVLALRFVAGLSAEQAGEALGKSAGAVRVLQHRALKALQRELRGAMV